jgi:ABC-type Fe3+ transport system permease subunit
MWLFFILGCVTMGLLHLGFVLFWHGYYSHHPSEGRVPTFFTSSIASFWITGITLFAVSMKGIVIARRMDG